MRYLFYILIVLLAWSCKDAPKPDIQSYYPGLDSRFAGLDNRITNDSTQFDSLISTLNNAYMTDTAVQDTLTLGFPEVKFIDSYSAGVWLLQVNSYVSAYADPGLLFIRVEDNSGNAYSVWQDYVTAATSPRVNNFIILYLPTTTTIQIEYEWSGNGILQLNSGPSIPTFYQAYKLKDL